MTEQSRDKLFAESPRVVKEDKKPAKYTPEPHTEVFL